MKIEFKILIYSMINNLIISVVKVIGGVALNLNSLFADGLHTFSDFVTDIVCMIGSKISRKKPNKYHPFGYGKVEYLTNLFVGIVLLALGLFIVIGSFGKVVIVPPLSLLILLLVVFVLKLIAIVIMHIVGKKINSQLLITSVRESKADLYSTIGVAIIAILLQFLDEIPILKYADLIGTILIGLIVLKTAYKVIIENSLSLIGEVEMNSEVNNKVSQYLEEFKAIKNKKITLIKYGSYYRLQLLLELDNNLSLKQAINLENKIKIGILRHRSFRIKYVTIYVIDKI